VVSIFTYRDERKLFALIGAIVVSALVTLVQLEAAKTGKPSIIAVAVTSVAVFAQSAVTAVADTVRGLTETLADAPHLLQKQSQLESENASLRAENARMREALAQLPQAAAIEQTMGAHAGGIVATTIGYDPENASRTIEIDRGSDAGVRADSGVIDEDGVVGRVIGVTPATATVLLVTDGASKVPAIVQRGRWWGIATGSGVHVRMQYVSQDAKLKVGDVVVTGAGRSFAPGLTIGKIAQIDHPEGSLYQTAIVAPAVAFGRLAQVVVLPPNVDTQPTDGP
jgi:rod shape-determining protein MreC